eukprot:846338-Prymnesium_polylepis.2
MCIRDSFDLALSGEAGGRYGTVSQTALLVSAREGCAYYAYRPLHDGAPPGPWTWQRVPLPAAGAVHAPDGARVRS